MDNHPDNGYNTTEPLLSVIQQPKNNRRKVVISLLIALVVIVVAIAGLFAIKALRGNQTATLNTQASETVAPTPSATPVTIAPDAATTAAIDDATKAASTETTNDTSDAAINDNQQQITVPTE